MSASITAEEWLSFVQREYLDSFIKDGGSSIKFIVPMDAVSHAMTRDGLRAAAVDSDYLFAEATAEDTRIHMMDQLFFRIAEQVDWRGMSQRVLDKLAIRTGCAPAEAGAGTYIERLAAANRMDPYATGLRMNPEVANDVFKNRKLSRDFRVAATQLCFADLSGTADGEARAAAITNWLTGRERAIAAVKPYGIFTRVHRTNARHLFVSLLRWIRTAGLSGMVLTIDISRVTLAPNPHDGKVFYAKSARFDAYELMRQFVDATDEMKGLFLSFIGERELLDLDLRRGFSSYPALQARVSDEVRDEHLVNPMTALVRMAQDGSN